MLLMKTVTHQSKINNHVHNNLLYGNNSCYNISIERILFATLGSSQIVNIKTIYKLISQSANIPGTCSQIFLKTMYSWKQYVSEKTCHLCTIPPIILHLKTTYNLEKMEQSYKYYCNIISCSVSIMSYISYKICFISILSYLFVTTLRQ